MTRHNDESGMTMLEMIAALFVLGVITVFMAEYVNRGAAEIGKKAAAQQLKRYAEAAQLYIEDNYATLQATATPTNAAVVATANLIAGGYLPASFGDNPWKQSYALYVLEPAGKPLEGLVLTRGGTSGDREFQNRLIPATAALAGAVAGYVPSGLLPSEPASTIQGSFGGWKLDISGTTIPNPGPGHLAAYLPFARNAAATDYLYRPAVPGHPELNRMSTNLDMDGNTINMGVGDVGGGDTEGVRSLNLEDAPTAGNACDDTDNEEGRIWYDDAAEGFFICMNGVRRKVQTTVGSAFLKDFVLTSPGDTVDKPGCPADLPTQQIFLYPANFAANTTGRYIKGVQVWADSISSTQWQVHMEVMTDLGWVEPDRDFGTIVAVTKCSP